MRLSTIRLAGFKSFVDPTTLALPTNLTGIVGPNGCGKSNIIDAVRWVMGESAASRLRGDAMSDVIFSGSSARKPVGTAMVELVFDNSDGKIGGEYAAFGEISVKRVVARDGGSAYYLNGTRCRRRDIADLFLGTGLGPRSYSIIEQGMISRVIDAHPEELRAHLEEAAGISRYKERRRETENRIQHTRENLERLNDLREEVERQLEHLKRQARAAERYQELVDERARLDAELRALEYRGLRATLTQADAEILETQTALEACMAALRERELAIESERLRRDEAAEAVSAAQAAVYEASGRLGQIEQQIRHTRELAERIGRERDELEQALAEVDSHLRADAEQVELLHAALERAEPELQRRQQQLEADSAALGAAEAALADWQRRWEAHNQASAAASRAAEVERTRADFLDRQAGQASRRIEALENERAADPLPGLRQSREALGLALDEAALRTEALEQQLAMIEQSIQQRSSRQRELQQQLDVRRQSLQAHRGRLASLEALQQAALGQDDRKLAALLARVGLDGDQRLAVRVRAEPRWERAVESVLGARLQSLLCEAPLRRAAGLASEKGLPELTLVDPLVAEPLESPEDSLARQIAGPAAVLAWLAHVHCAADLEQARSLLPSLPPGHSVVTPEGYWLGSGWLRLPGAQTEGLGVLERERELARVRAAIDEDSAQVAELEQQLASVRERLLTAQGQREEQARALHRQRRELAELGGQRSALDSRIEAALERVQTLDRELAELGTQRQHALDEARAVRLRLERALAELAAADQQRSLLEAERSQRLEQREAAQQRLRSSRGQLHELALSVESQRAALRSLEQAMQRLAAQRSQFGQRREQLELQAAAGLAPIAQLEQLRQTVLADRVDAEQRLTAARRGLEDIDALLRQHELERQRLDQALGQQRERLSEQRLETERLRVQAEQLAASFAGSGQDLQALLDELEGDGELDTRRQRLDELAQRIRRLEPVNLAAIHEHAQLAERKRYLDAQDADLRQALETLEEAMRRIDRETRTRFKETFDRVNQGLQELFPRLFGGGHAYLELTGEDLLSTGVAIMARPPGKRVTSISLLSGGEKAMTAVALVFAIFRLNPAPFCLLDEVDAPLDEANVGRFSAMVREMSERVQFVIVTHNKGTMEIAEQLAGVTMREPGVSRLVSVDLAEASRLAGAQVAS